jgi:hypothetical protein
MKLIERPSGCGSPTATRLDETNRFLDALPGHRRFYGSNAWYRSVAYPTGLFYDGKEELDFAINMRPIGLVNNPSLRQAGFERHAMVETYSLGELRTANDRHLFDASVYTKLNDGRKNDG